MFRAIPDGLPGLEGMRVGVCALLCLCVQVREAAESVGGAPELGLLEAVRGGSRASHCPFPGACTAARRWEGATNSSVPCSHKVQAVFYQRTVSEHFLPLVLAAHPSKYQGGSRYFSDENHHFTEVGQLDSGSKVIMGFTFRS